MADFYEDKNEAGWEEYLQWSDKYSSRCFALLKRFMDLPECDELVNQKLDEEFGGLEVFEATPSWDYATEIDRFAEENPVDEQLDEREDPEARYAEWADTPQLRRSLENVSCRARQVSDGLHQAIFDWCNVFAVVFPQGNHPDGMRALFHISRALSYLNLGMDGLMARRSFSVVAVFKRCLGDVNAAIGIFQRLHDTLGSQIEDLLKMRSEQLIPVAENLEELIIASRKLIAEGRKF